MTAPPALRTHVVDAERWPDLVSLFGPSGAQRGCWCMYWRLPSSEFGRSSGDDNRAALEDAVRHGRSVGLLGYDGGTPIAWCALAPRQDYTRILRSPTLKPEPTEPPTATIWSVTCFFIRAGHRRSGLAEAMLRAAVRHLREAGVEVVEGYPVDTDGGRLQGDIHSGTIGLFTRAGFELHRRPPSGRRVIMRKTLSPDPLS